MSSAYSLPSGIESISLSASDVAALGMPPAVSLGYIPGEAGGTGAVAPLILALLVTPARRHRDALWFTCIHDDILPRASSSEDKLGNPCSDMCIHISCNPGT